MIIGILMWCSVYFRLEKQRDREKKYQNILTRRQVCIAEFLRNLKLNSNIVFLGKWVRIGKCKIHTTDLTNSSVQLSLLHLLYKTKAFLYSGEPWLMCVPFADGQ